MWGGGAKECKAGIQGGKNFKRYQRENLIFLFWWGGAKECKECIQGVKL